MAVQSLFVVNKAGGLMFQRTYGETAPRLTPNDYLHLASTFHGMQLLVQELSPSPLPKSITAPTGGIRALETPSLSLAALTSPTGVQFLSLPTWPRSAWAPCSPRCTACTRMW
eukprot:TRINITY_DN2363_c0_g1_i8.p2 TRINITY_DN2363_c0_g1~~TRINITY_DN2363_c0_g1_i8.p2  ORF type:complete len:113 (+),score=18.45 TRINITY_DN2363_c0_g1_i8:103-441(+)